MSIIDQHKERLELLCKTYKVDKMYIFGCALNEKFNNKSYVDLLVKFKEFDLANYFLNYINFKEELKLLLIER
ncbi:hypothetical protein I5M32_05025 [Pedobacter sp. SD-b]|uniref:Polymerase beta nucleotidyltransferase domain-containing protein n=1 Tax=Pedobacter segetis TaxID=2793069 RepID=A0ABS1BHM4_9SPHI|nr:hypothetical protein [Pedobacter segetis]MBK0382317.1 hypothetical protein [Pedobacter segetis]